MKSSLLSNPFAPLPVTIAKALGKLIRRARQLMVIRGLCATCAVGIGTLLTMMLIDAQFTFLACWPRYLMAVTTYSAWIGSAYWSLIRPLKRSFTLTGIARLIETQHPEFHERISSVVQLLNSKEAPATRGSDVLIGALTEEAVRDALALKPRREISFQGAVPFLATAGTAALLLATLWMANPGQTRFLMARAVAPFLNLPNVQAADILVNPGDTLITSGSRLRISIQTSNAVVTSARLLREDRQGHETGTDMVAVTAMTNTPTRGFAVTLPAVSSGFRYRIQANTALTRYFTVRVAIPPVIEHLNLHCHYPEYSGLLPLEERDSPGIIRALAGSEITVSILANKPVSFAVMRIATPASTNTIKGIRPSSGDGRVYEFHHILPPRLDGCWSVILTDAMGLANPPSESVIQTIPDNPPTASIINLHQRELHLNRETCLPVIYSAGDDLGLTSLALIFIINGTSNETVRPIPLPAMPAGQSVKTVHGETQIAMDSPLFAKASRATFHLRATDNLPATLGGPQTGNSDTFTIIFNDWVPSWKEQVLANQENRIQKGLKQIQQQLGTVRDLGRALAVPLAKQSALEAETLKKIGLLQASLASSDIDLHNLATDIDKGFYPKLAAALAALAENHLDKAENMADQLRLVDAPSERTALNSNVTAEAETSLLAITQAIKDHDAARTGVRNAVILDRLAGKQSALAQERQELERMNLSPASETATPSQTDKSLNLWAGKQEQVASQLAALAKEIPGTPGQVAAATSNLAALAASQIRALAIQQAELLGQTTRLMSGEAHDGEKVRAKLAEQTQIGHRIDDLAKDTDIVRAQTGQVLARTQAGPHASKAAREMAQAAQSSSQAAQTMKQAAGILDRASNKPSLQRLQAAADQARQAQQSAAQHLEQALQSLEQAAQAMSLPATSSPIQAQVIAPEELAKAYGSARRAATRRQAADAEQTASLLATANGKALSEAKALGGNARPAILNTSSAGGGEGQDEAAPISDDVRSAANRSGLGLQDWIKLNSALKEDALQAAGDGETEEYRPLIKRYFREISSHGEDGQ